ncbi:MAG: protein kinase, partial [Planctomycetes bacterium]|nr:protein kinase [Planctomycetota bacterium]
MNERCVFCEEPVPGGLPSEDCPFQGGPGCPMAPVERDQLVIDPLEETIAQRSGPPLPENDGFPAEDDLVDSMLGQYEMGEVIGRGAMGRVYRAQHTGLGRTCAVKVLSPGLVARQPRNVERFWAEARAVAGLIHPNVVTVHNLGSARGYHYIEMEYVPG